MRKLLYIFLVFSLFSCLKKEIPFEGKDAKVYLALSSTFSTDSLMTVFLSATQSVVGKDVKATIFTNKDASVNVVSEDGTKEMLTYNENKKAFIGTNKAIAGNKYTIKAKAEGVDEVEAIVNIPRPAIITNVSDLNKITEDSQGDRTLKFSFNEPKGKNFYKLNLYYTYANKSYSDGHIINSYNRIDYIPFKCKDKVFGKSEGDDIFDESEGDSDKSNITAVFTDELITTDSYELNITIPSEYINNWLQDLEFYVSLQTISEDYFLFLQSFDAYNNTDDSPFSEPVQLWSNINGGFGIAGGYSVSTKKIYTVGKTAINNMSVDSEIVNVEQLPLIATVNQGSTYINIFLLSGYSCEIIRNNISILKDENGTVTGTIPGLAIGENLFDIKVKDDRGNEYSYDFIITRR